MGAPLLKLAGLNLGRHLRVAHDEGLAPTDPEAVEPEFSGLPFTGQGAAHVGDAVQNYEHIYPLLVEAQATERTNLVTNPKGALGTDGWTNAALSNFVAPQTPVTSEGLPGGITTAFGCVGTTSGSRANANFAVENGETYTVSVYIRIIGLSGATGILVRILDSASGFVVDSSTNSTEGGAFIRLSATFTATETATWNAAVRQVGAGTPTWQFTAAFIEESDSPGSYFDGDDLDAEWSGTPNASTSQTLTGRAGLKRMVERLNTAIAPGAQLQYAHDADVDESTFFDVEGGRFEPEYQYRLVSHNTLRGVLRLWTRPYGHTGTARVVASTIGTGIRTIQATGVLGDVDAQAQFLMRASPGAGTDQLAFYGLKYPAPSGYDPIVQPTTSGGGVTASVVGASGAMGSQYLGHQLVPTQVTDQTVGNYSVNRPQDVGRYRLLAIAQNKIRSASLGPSGPVYSFALSYQRTGGFVTRGLATIPLASVGEAGDQGYQVLDAGEVTVSTAIASQRLSITYRGASGASTIATWPFRLDALVMLPIDQNAGFYVDDESTLSIFEPWMVFDPFTPDVRASGHAGELFDKFRGDFPELPAVGSPGASGAAHITVGIGNGANWVGNLANDFRAEARERWKFLR